MANFLLPLWSGTCLRKYMKSLFFRGFSLVPWVKRRRYTVTYVTNNIRYISTDQEHYLKGRYSQIFRKSLLRRKRCDIISNLHVDHTTSYYRYHIEI